MARKIQKRRKDVTFKMTERDRNDGSLRPGSESNVAEPDSSTRANEMLLFNGWIWRHAPTRPSS